MTTATFNTKREAEAFAAKRRKGFRKTLKNTNKDDYYKSSPSRLKEREKYLRESIKTVKVKRTKLKHWSKPLYEVVGR